MIDIEQLKIRHSNFYDISPVSIDELKDIEDKLNVVLPDDFKEISAFYSGGYLGGISHLDMASQEGTANILAETLRLREKIDLSHSYVVLAEPPESLIVLNVGNNDFPKIIWCDAVEARNLNSYQLINAPDTWNSYAEFFSYLLDEEEEDN